MNPEEKVNFIVAKSGFEASAATKEDIQVVPLEWLIQSAIVKTLLKPSDFKDVLRKSKGKNEM